MQSKIGMVDSGLRTNKKIGNYVFCVEDPPLGSGSFGKVYKGKVKETKLIVTIKQVPIPGHPEGFPGFEILINREIISMSALSHDYILKFIELVCTENNFYLITEFCDGGDLGKIKGKLNYKSVLTILKQITSAMMHANSQKVIHRDLKPQNILIHKKAIKIGDFGYARLIECDSKMTPMVGTPAYMAPEVFSSKLYSQNCDVWSTGILTIRIFFF